MRPFLYLLMLFTTTALAESPVAKCAHFPYGFFSGFHTIIGLLDAYDNGKLGGIEVDLKTTGFYYDKAKGPNWWQYYFEPFSMNIEDNAPRIHIDLDRYRFYSHRGDALAKTRSCYLINKYIKIQPKILKELNDFLRKNVETHYLIGVHYRGTDKMWGEASRLSVSSAVNKIEQELSHMEKPSNFKIFVATDSQHFLDYMKNRFGTKICYFEMERSTDNQPIHSCGKSSGYEKGKTALLDCLVLSKTNFLFCTSSNLNNVSLMFNPSIAVFYLNEDTRWWKKK